jgi:asparagine synthase (glutamine-hydrolysing)
MCGIFGFVSDGGPYLSRNQLLNTTNRLSSRGPDDVGAWLSDNKDVGFGHRRLAILDITPAGSQPMQSSSGRFVITFNGEIYNHLELRKYLEPYEWRSLSDTETLLVAIEKWGVEATLKSLVGMFGFGVWDNASQELTLARDRMGEKPVYYGCLDNTFLFASELKAFTTLPNWKGRINRSALSSFMRYSYVPCPVSIFEGIFKLNPGTFLVVPKNRKSLKLSKPKQYFSIIQTATRPRIQISAIEVVDQTETRLKNAISRQMLSDVPLGAFLSGGIDSSIIVSLMQAQMSKGVKTFTIGFHGKDYNEANFAKNIAAYLGAEHTELYLSPKDVLDSIPILPRIYDEPFGDPSCIPTFLVSKLAKDNVTVVLSGDGGDELFGGYNRYLNSKDIWMVIGALPVSLRRHFIKMLISISPERMDSFLQPFRKLLPEYLQVNSAGDKIHKILEILDSQTNDEFYKRLISHCKADEKIVLAEDIEPGWADEQFLSFKSEDFVERMMIQDLLAYLPDDILTKVDRASMSVGLEARAPFLDHELVEFALQIPKSEKIKNGQGKWPLRQILKRHLPEMLVDRPKQGFTIPLANWLREPLRDWAEELLQENVLREQGFLNVPLVRKKWSEHLSGRRNWQYLLWNILMWQAWLAEPHNKYE